MDEAAADEAADEAGEMAADAGADAAILPVEVVVAAVISVNAAVAVEMVLVAAAEADLGMSPSRVVARARDEVADRQISASPTAAKVGVGDRK